MEHLTLDELIAALHALRAQHPSMADDKVFQLNGTWIEVDAREVDLEAYVR